MAHFHAHNQTRTTPIFLPVDTKLSSTTINAYLPKSVLTNLAI